jgi:amino acid adenylation domain-containing protein
VAEPRPDRAFEPIPASVLDSSIAARFREVAARMPDAPAVESGETVWSYGELASRADRVSHAVWSAVGGVVEGRVALLLGHDAGMVAGVLGVLGAGQAYVPLDPYAPADRLRRILADAAPSAIVTDGAHRALLETLEPAVPVVELESAWALAVDGPVEVEIGPDAAAYLLYTSGSTGEPKGVVQSQRGVLHHVRTYVNRLHVGSGDRLSLLSAYGFDASVMDLFGALLSGATLVPLDLRGAAVGRLATEVAERGITVYHSTPTVYRHLVAGLGAAERLAGVRLVVLGGEAVVGADVDRYRRHFAAGCLLVNGLGPTECTLALQQWLDHGVELERGEVPVGRAVEGVEAEVVNEAGEPVAEWATGELVLRSRYLAQGYWGRPDLTAAAFGEGDEAGVRIYRTGDLGRRLPDGRIVFVGRRDGQVKVRGYRIETGEVESALVAQAGVREAVVLLREAEGGEPELAAYVVPAVGARVPGAAELREAVRNRLPEYMVPAAYAAIDAVPMTANGKVDRRALLAMEVERAGGAAASEYAAPRTPLEEVLVGIWQEVLGVEEVGIQASFFELGGHSLRAMQVVSRIRVVLGVELPLRALFEAPSVAELAARVERLRRGDAEEADMLPPVEPVERDGPQPLSFAQQRLWFLQQLEPESTAYNLRSAVRLKGELDVSALRRAFDAVVARHESLRTVFREVDGEPRQVVLEAGPAALEFEDLSGLEAVERESAVAGRVSAAAGWIFDLNEGPLFRGWLLRLGEAEHVLVVVKHHIITDGWSMRLLTGEIGRLYAAYRAGGEAVLPALPIQYADYAVWQRRFVEGPVLERELAYWKDQLAGLEPLELPADRARPASGSMRAETVGFRLPAELLAGLRRLSVREGSTLAMTMLAAFQALLGRYTGREDVAVGSPIANRQQRGVEDLIGFFVNTQVLRTDLSGSPTFRELVGRVRETWLAAQQHQNLPFERLVEALQPERDLTRNPLVQVVFAVQNAPLSGVGMPGVEVEAVRGGEERARMDLELHLREDRAERAGSALEGVCRYAADLYDRERIERLLAHYVRLLERVVEDAEVRLSAVDLLDASERSLLLEEWNRTELESAAAQLPDTVCAMFEAQADRTPAAEAVSFGERRLSYAELDGRANRLAQWLKKRGVGPEVCVGVSLERSPELVVAVLGILKAGGAYVPLDPEYPAERLRFMVTHARVPLVLTQGSLAAELGGLVPADVAVVPLESDPVAAAIAEESTERPEGGADSQNLAYVIYTSGSTGEPKGVAMPHGPLVQLVEWHNRTAVRAAAPRTLTFAPVSFDVSFQELFTTLAAGGTLVLVTEEDRRDPDRLLEILETRKIDHLFLPFVALQQLAEAAERVGRGPESLKELYCAGEQLQVTPAIARFFERLPGCRLHNQYGPTETHVITAHTLDGSPSDGRRFRRSGGRSPARGSTCWTGGWSRRRSAFPASCTWGARRWLAATSTARS